MWGIDDITINKLTPSPKYGLFYEQDQVEARLKDRPQRIRQGSIIDPAAVGCDNCALKQRWPMIRTKCMDMTTGVRDASLTDIDVLFIGEAPGEKEDQQAKQFVGKSGDLLRGVIRQRQLERVAFQNVVRCRPENNRDPTVKEVHACSVHLDKDIATLPNLKAIVGVGNIVLQRYFRGGQIRKLHGERFPVRTKDGRIVWYYPILHPSFVLRMADEYERETSPALPVFEADIKRFFAEVDSWPAPFVHDIRPEHVTIVHSRDEAWAHIATMQGPFGIDIETLKLHPHEVGAKILTAAISDGCTTIAFSCEHPEAPTDWGLTVLLEVLLRFPWIAHNANFELGWFNTYWPEFKYDLQPFEDSMGLGRLYHNRNSILALEDLTMVHLGVNIKTLTNVDASNIMAYTLEEVLPYNGLDALGSALLWHVMHKDVEGPNYDRILGAVTATTDMELLGLPVNLAESARLKVQWEQQHQEILNEIATMPEVRQFEHDLATPFSIQSNEHIATALTRFAGIELPTTKSEKKVTYQTDEAALAPHTATNALARLVLEEREARKIISTYIVPLLEVPKRYTDARLHGAYTTMHTHPLRLSSTDPNMQNFPQRKHKEIRCQVEADDGCILVKFDFGQLQVRIEGMATRDRHLCKVLIEGLDMHTEWRDRILKAYPDYWYRIIEKTGESKEDKILKEGRNLIKSDFVFANLFGATVRSVSERTGIPESIMRNIADEFWDEFRGVLEWIKERRQEYRETGTVTSMTGHVRRGLLWGNEMINAPIQFGEATIVMDVMNELNALSRTERDIHFAPRIQIHDDLTFMLPNGNDLTRYIDVIQRVMVRVRFPWQIVPLNVEASLGPNWGEFEQFAVFEGDYVRG